MDFDRYKFFYVNGCSFSEGGGLEETSISKDSVVPLYEKIYNVTWKDRLNVNYGKRLEQIIGLKCINEAKCGSGTQRVVRTTYDFIYKNWENRDKFFILLEKPDSTRSEVYYNKKRDYYIVNSLITKSNKIKFTYATREYYGKFQKDDNENQTIFQNWFDNHYNLEKRYFEDEKLYVGLYSFCKLNSIKIFLMNYNETMFSNCFDVNDIIKFSNNVDSDSISEWCIKNKLTISNELNGLVLDSHPGFFGHIEYSKKLASFLGWKDEYPSFPNYYDYIKLNKTVI